jgi:K(+)-stimulated pyrophosphate-energized sodium pump
MNDLVVDFDPARGYLAIVLCVSALSLLIAALLARYVIAQDSGTPQMQRISNAIRQGAEAFLRRQNKTIAVLALLLSVLIFAGYSLSSGGLVLASRMTVAFLAGAVCSMAAGFSGMWVSIRSNIRVSAANTQACWPAR